VGGEPGYGRGGGSKNQDFNRYPGFIVSNIEYVFIICNDYTWNRNISVGTATGHGFDGRGSILDRGKKIFPTPQLPHRLQSNGYGGTFPGVKRQGREVDQSTPSSAEVEEWWSYTPAPPYVFMAWCLTKLLQGQFYL
jgi:hypothetical protein